MLTRESFENLDKDDQLAYCRDLFDLSPNLVYLNGNSLGAMPKSVTGKLKELAEKEWSGGLIRSWLTSSWYEMPQRIGDKIARLIGAGPGEVIVADSTSVNLFKLVAAALNKQKPRYKIVADTENFPTDLYVLQGLASMLPQVELVLAERDQLEQLVDENTAILVLAQTAYKSGELYDMEAVTALAQSKGALMLWDLSHSCGAFPVDLNGVGADLAVGCGYKYLNGGPGAPAYLYVAKTLQADLKQPLAGWMGHADPFAMSLEYQPAEGIRSMLCGTHPVIGMASLEQGVDLFGDIDMQLVVMKSRQMGELFIRLVEERCSDYGFKLASPRDSSKRGSQVSFQHDQAYAIMQALIERDVIGDFRAPDCIRFGFTPLYLRYVDIWRAVDRLEEVMENALWNDEKYKSKNAVT